MVQRDTWLTPYQLASILPVFPHYNNIVVTLELLWNDMVIVYIGIDCYTIGTRTV